jgi:hypothetical protein
MIVAVVVRESPTSTSIPLSKSYSRTCDYARIATLTIHDITTSIPSLPLVGYREGISIPHIYTRCLLFCFSLFLFSPDFHLCTMVYYWFTTLVHRMIVSCDILIVVVKSLLFICAEWYRNLHNVMDCILPHISLNSIQCRETYFWPNGFASVKYLDLNKFEQLTLNKIRIWIFDFKSRTNKSKSRYHSFVHLNLALLHDSFKLLWRAWYNLFLKIQT